MLCYAGYAVWYNAAWYPNDLDIHQLLQDLEVKVVLQVWSSICIL